MDAVALSDATYAIASFLSQQDNVPYLFGKKNIHTQCNISSNRCFIKTEDSIGFGWNIKYHLEEVDDETTSRRKTKQAVIDNVFCSVIIQASNSGRNSFVIPAWYATRR